MKKTKTTGSPKRQYTGKKTTKKNASPRKRRTKKSSDFLRALQLAAMIGAISIFISLSIIMIHSNFIKPVESGILIVNVESDIDTQMQNDISILISHNKNDDEPVQPLTETADNSALDVLNTFQPVVDNKQTTAPASRPDIQPTVNRPAVTTPAVSTNTVQPAASTTTAINTSVQRPVETIGTLVFVIDDAGNNLDELEPFLRISYPLTIAVMPGLPYSAEAARRIRAVGKEVILHQPMEALGGQNPGPGAIYSGMSEAEIRSVLKRNIDEIGPVAGMNNHQGSRITADREMMDVILSFCKENGLYFLDSRTTVETVIPVEARRLGVKITERDTFIDNEQDRASMINYINTGLQRAQKNGSAVMIGHTWSPLLAPLLAEQLAILSRQGYSIKTVSDIIK